MNTDVNIIELEEAEKLHKYFIKNYIINDKVKYWNVCTEEEKTNNACESLNRVLNLFFRKRRFNATTKKPTYDQFIVTIYEFMQYMNLRQYKKTRKNKVTELKKNAK